MSGTSAKHTLFYFIGLFLLFSLTGCYYESGRFTPLEDYEEEYELLGSFDIRELEEQVDGYWGYYEENERQKARKAEELRNWNPEFLKAGTYTIGKDIPAGLYICRTNWQDSEDFVEVKYEEAPSEKEFSTQFYCPENESYILLRPGGVLTFSENAKVALADDQAPSLAAEKDGIYYTGSYKVGEEIPEGEYFMLSTTNSEYLGRIEKEGEKSVESVLRFGYVTISDAKIINMENCILFPLDKRPAVHPIQYQGEGEGAGGKVYAEGTYKIGTNLPIGTYKIKNELFRSVTDLSFKGYHGNESYYPRRANRAGICGTEMEDQEYFGWSWLEIDSNIHNKTRYLKRHSLRGEDGVQKFNGLPTVTFTQEDAGRQIDVINCILIPERKGSKVSGKGKNVWRNREKR